MAKLSNVKSSATQLVTASPLSCFADIRFAQTFDKVIRRGVAQATLRLCRKGFALAVQSSDKVESPESLLFPVLQNAVKQLTFHGPSLSSRLLVT
jgi:hypothetical protein